MKKLDKYVLKSFLAPFLAAFFVVLFVLIMLALWQQFDKIAGRGLGPSVILKFFGYTTLLTIPMALSIGILLSSIMALGNLSENYEFAAIKSAGISLHRMLRPLIILMIILSFANFLFLNYVFPVATYEAKNLVYNIKKKQPALALIAGSFNSDIPGFSIKFAKKYGEESNLLEDVIIYDLRDNRYNNKVITAKYGEITTKPGSKYMTLILKDGYYFDDIKQKKNFSLTKDKMPFIKSHFSEHQINFDISDLDKIDDKKYDQHYEMMSLNQLKNKVKKLKKPLKESFENNRKRYYLNVKGNKLFKDTIKDTIKYKTNILDNYNQKNKLKVLENSNREIKRIKNVYDNLKKDFTTKNRRINIYETEFFKRIAFAISCLILFLIGAPLGSLIRKGGFGVPMIMAILVFVAYHFVGTMAKGMAENGSISPFLGGWFSTILMFPLGLYLLYKAVQDKGFINLEAFTKPIQNFFKKLFTKKQKAI